MVALITVARSSTGLHPARHRLYQLIRISPGRFGLGGLPDALKGWRGTSWLLGDAITGDKLKALAFGLSLVAGIATLGCGVAVAFSGSFHGGGPGAPRLI